MEAIQHGVDPDSRTKVLFVLDEFPGPYAGTETQFWLLVNGLDRRRFAPSILLLRESSYLREHAGDIPVHVIDVLRLKSVSGLVRIVQAARWARRQGFRIAHIFLNDAALAFPLPLAMLGIKVIVSRRDLGFWYSRMNLPILRLQAKFVSAVVANSRAVADVVTQAEGFAAAAVRVIYNGLARSASLTMMTRTALGVPESAAVVVVVANLRPLKRVGDVVSAIGNLAAQGELKVHLLLVGDDRPGDSGVSHQQELRALAEQVGVAEQVHFLGMMPDPMPVIALSDVCVLASDTEGLSNVIIEYMSAGKPVVATDVGGNSELIVEGATGYLIKPRDVAALERALSNLLRNPTIAAQLGSAGRTRTESVFAARAMIAQHESLYRELLSPTAQREPSSVRT